MTLSLVSIWSKWPSTAQTSLLFRKSSNFCKLRRFWQIFLTEKAPCLLNDWSNNRLICFTFTRRIPLDWKGIVLTRIQQALYLLFCLFCWFVATFLRRLSIRKRLFSLVRPIRLCFFSFPDCYFYHYLLLLFDLHLPDDKVYIYITW